MTRLEIANSLLDIAQKGVESKAGYEIPSTNNNGARAIITKAMADWARIWKDVTSGAIEVREASPEDMIVALMSIPLENYVNTTPANEGS
jgi:hypothetical protein